jgi:hypothetical protein
MTAVEWLIDWMGKNQYFIGNDLIDAFEKAKQIEQIKRESIFVEGYKARALGSNQIFDSEDESNARILFKVFQIVDTTTKHLINETDTSRMAI